MAYCENIHCGKTGLRKEDVERDLELNAMLCHGCYCLRHPGWKPPLECVVLPTADQRATISYGLNVDSYRGVSGRISYADVTFEVIFPVDTIKKLLGSHG